MLPNVQASDGGMYTCVVSDAAGSNDASTFLYISPYFNTQPLDLQGSNGSSAVFMCIAESFPSPVYQWHRVDEEPIREELVTHTSMLVFSPVVFGDEGEYYCSVTSLESTVHSLNATLSSMVYSKIL